MSSVKISAPASIANLGPGFDVFAISLSSPRDFVEATLSDSLSIVEVTGRNSSDIPKDPSKNSVTIAASKVMSYLDVEQGLKFKIEKGIPIERGLGGSGASAVAGAIAANELLGGELSASEIIEAAAFAEGKIAGTPHYDNVAASTLGSFIIVSSTNPLDFIEIHPPEMKIVVAVPEDRASTKDGREILSKSISLRDISGNIGRASTMVAALKDGDLSTFAKHMIDDLVEPIRASKIPGFLKAKNAALDAGALGAAMAGAGPSVFAVLDSEEDLGEVKKAMKDAFEREGQECEMLETRPGLGPEISWEGD
ncbi:MAG: homoserine kinase [Hadesarchaea archaeon]|nr:homoserine kinase [Hadesarchaea archaeon]